MYVIVYATRVFWEGRCKFAKLFYTYL